MEFGNWKVTEDSIEWKDRHFQKFVIPSNALTRTRKSFNDQIFYDWIMLATDEDWLTQNDLYDLNYAFVYAVAKFNASFDYKIFDTTLEEQYNLLDDEEDDEE